MVKVSGDRHGGPSLYSFQVNIPNVGGKLEQRLRICHPAPNWRTKRIRNLLPVTLVTRYPRLIMRERHAKQAQDFVHGRLAAEQLLSPIELALEVDHLEFKGYTIYLKAARHSRPTDTGEVDSLLDHRERSVFFTVAH